MSLSVKKATSVKPYIYLATPYSSKNTNPIQKLKEQAKRFREAMRITSVLMAKGHHIYSPIVHCHPIACKYELPKDWAYWERHLRVVLPHMDEVWVAMMPGWGCSTGVQAEIELAHELDIPVKYVEPTNCYIWETMYGDKSS